jgi:short-subunit dehydrogenase
MATAIRRAMVTGATGGLGREFAGELARQAWMVTAVARDDAALQQLCSRLPGSGHASLAADLESETGMATVVDRLRAEHYTLLINNAGVGLYGEFEAIPVVKQQRMIRLNCEALTVLAHAYLSEAQSGDTLLNTASTLGFASFPFGAAYAATKAYVIALSEALWYEQTRRGVNVIALCPGATRTAFHTHAGSAEASPFPNTMFQDPGDVIRTAMRAIERRHPAVKISGLMNALLVGSGRLIPRTWVVRIMGGFAPTTA